MPPVLLKAGLTQAVGFVVKNFGGSGGGCSSGVFVASAEVERAVACGEWGVSVADGAVRVSLGGARADAAHDHRHAVWVRGLFI